MRLLKSINFESSKTNASPEKDVNTTSTSTSNHVNETKSNNNNNNSSNNSGGSEEAADVAALKISSSTTSTTSPLKSNSSVNNIITKTSSSHNFTPAGFTQALEDRLKRAIRQGFLNLDDQLRRMPEFDKGEDKSGSTAVACLITPSHVYLINCGDSRAILVSAHSVALGTYDHKPINPNERERIQNAGGSVMIQRVNGSLAVSRALGDYEYKCVEGRGPCEQLVSPEPEVTTTITLTLFSFSISYK